VTLEKDGEKATDVKEAKSYPDTFVLAKETGKRIGYAEACTRVSQEIMDKATEIADLVSDPEERAKVLTTLIVLAGDIVDK
jgi:hypothetical protein